MKIEHIVDISSPEAAAAKKQAALICHTYYRECRPERAKGIEELLADYTIHADPELEAWMEREMEEAAARYSSRCEVHGFDHAFRAALYTCFLSQMLELGRRDTQILFFAALNHDIGREDDSNDPYYGFRGAAAAAGICGQFSDEEAFLIRAVIAAHPFKDKDADDIISLFGTPDGRQREKYHLYLSILKDADALDRFRLSKRSLDLKYLRYRQSLELVPAACELVQIFNAAGESSSDTRTIDWDEAADYYGLVSELALSCAREQLETIGLERGSTLLDLGAGCGRYSIAASPFCSRITALDQSEKMLAYCRKWCAQEKITNVETVCCDWNDLDTAEAAGKYDYVLTSRTGTPDIMKLSAIARKAVIVIDWANAPSFPDLTMTLCGKENLLRYPLGTSTPPSRQFGYNCHFREAYKAGYEPNVRILRDGFDCVFADRQEADRTLIGLAEGNMKKGCRDRILQNFEQFYDRLPDGRIRVKLESRAAVIWWNTARKDMR